MRRRVEWERIPLILAEKVGEMAMFASYVCREWKSDFDAIGPDWKKVSGWLGRPGGTRVRAELRRITGRRFFIRFGRSVASSTSRDARGWQGARSTTHSHSVPRRKRTRTRRARANRHDRIWQNHWADAAARKLDARLSRLPTQRYAKHVLRQVRTNPYILFSLCRYVILHAFVCVGKKKRHRW